MKRRAALLSLMAAAGLIAAGPSRIAFAQDSKSNPFANAKLTTPLVGAGVTDARLELVFDAKGSRAWALLWATVGKTRVSVPFSASLEGNRLTYRGDETSVAVIDGQGLILMVFGGDGAVGIVDVQGAILMTKLNVAVRGAKATLTKP